LCKNSLSSFLQKEAHVRFLSEETSKPTQKENTVNKVNVEEKKSVEEKVEEPKKVETPTEMSNVHKPVSSNAFASGANANSCNVLTDRPTTRVRAQPGGHCSIRLG
jgi:hypothetical protein